MNEARKRTVLMIISVVTLIIFAVGVTYAYFRTQGGRATQTDINVKTATTDSLVFSTGSDIFFTADQTSFGKGKGNKMGSSYAKVVLTANNSTNSATANYYVYLNITENSFKYTTSNKTAELILSITDKAGNEIKNLEGVSYVTIGGVSGYDITNKEGLVKIANNHEIVSTGTKEEDWNITITLVNLDSDQTANAGATFKAKINIQKEKINSVLADVCASGANLANCIKTLSTSSTVTGIYHHDQSLTNGANDDSYRYAGASENVNNYVCFGSDASTCPSENLYRIIGVFGSEVKLVKASYAKSDLLGTDGDYAGNNSYYWNYKNDTTINDGKGSNDWTTSLLNKVNLNTNFINNIGTTWANKITTHSWQIGGNFWSKIGVVVMKEVYQNEIVNPASNKTYDAKIGLMYASDYSYSASPRYWQNIFYNSNYTFNENKNLEGNYSLVKNFNWNAYDRSNFFISKNSDNSEGIFYMNNNGFVSNGSANSSWAGVYPTFYLSSNITYVSGEGTEKNPLRIA